MAMEKLKHISHECELASPEILTNNICNICYKDESVEFACKSCNFDLCKACSRLPGKVYHDFHPQHPLELSLFQYDRKPKYIICSGCGNMCSGSFYKCKTCEIYLDLGCALLKNIVKAWDVEEMLHDSHVHLLMRCRPGPDAEGDCLLCERPISPSSICYGCVYCYSFVHHKCIDLPKEIHHPVHPAHPLKRLSYLRTFDGLAWCTACNLKIDGVPYSCTECNIDLHLRCADALLRGLMHKSHQHRLFYVATGARYVFRKGSPCQICSRTDAISLESFYHCMECDVMFHFECLEIPEFLVQKSYHTHPLMCKIFVGGDDSLEYCGVCETMVHAGHHAYSCEECDFLGHIECILREEEPSPLYLKDLYLYGEDSIRATNREDQGSNEMEIKLMVNDAVHIHMMRPVDISELSKRANCKICKEKILGSACKCTTCRFQTHRLCAELGQPSRVQIFHQNHPLTLLHDLPIQGGMCCDKCRKLMPRGFNLFCRICNFIIDIRCALNGKYSLEMFGKKVIGKCLERCISDKHNVVQIVVSRSSMTACAICLEKFYGKAVACMTCGELYHSRCIEVWRESLYHHPLHSDHRLIIEVACRNRCLACNKRIEKYGYNCFICKISFHIECIKAVNISERFKPHIHYLYNFWRDDLRLNQACSVCARPCGASFYGCIDCNFNAHVECVGIATNVKTQRHQHSVVHGYTIKDGKCSHCGSECCITLYSCNHCSDFFHIRCLMPMDDRKAATEEEQLCDVYLMYLERDLLSLLED